MSFLNDLQYIWEQIRENLSKEINPSTMDLWFGTVSIVDFDEAANTIIFGTNSEFNYKVFASKYTPVLEKAFSDYFGFPILISVKFTGTPVDPQEILRRIYSKPFNPSIKAQEEEEGKKAQAYVDSSAESLRSEGDDANFEPSFAPAKPSLTDGGEELDDESLAMGILPIDYSFQYTFDNFIVGSSNKFAHAACTAVAMKPATDYNPLFIYGPSGLGKTHLMSAIVNEIKKNNPRARVLYIKGDDFTNQMIEALSKREMHKFHEKYRNCDILLIDDIQFIAGKTSTQEEFFHTFNALYEEHKQIVLSSDRPPKDIQTLEDRLKTRFEWGLIADIQPPDLELRIAIIKKKCEQVSITLSDEVLTFLAENLRSNIRQIEGTVKKLSAIVFLSGRTITMEIAAACLQEITGGVVPVQVIVDKIFSAVHKKYGVSKEELLGQRRTKDIAFARHVSIYLVRKILDTSFTSIARIFNRDHSTILASCELISKKINTDPLFAVDISELTKEINSGM